MRNDMSVNNLPEIDIPRSKFDMPHTLHTTFNSGLLVPIYKTDVLPGDTFDMNLVSNIRMSTPIVPVMDSCYLDTYFFFVPSRLCWNRWKEFCGENPRSNWTNDVDENLLLPHIKYTQSNIELPEGVHYLEGSLVDYFGLPIHDLIGTSSQADLLRCSTFDMLPFEAYNLIWNEFFRDENIQVPTPLYLQNTSQSDGEALSGIYYETGNYIAPSNSFPITADYPNMSDYLAVKRVAKFHDYFTSALPQPQKHVPISIPGFEDSMIVITGDQYNLPVNSQSMSFVGPTGSPLEGSAGFFMGDLASDNGSFDPANPQDGYSGARPNNLHVSFLGQVPNINDLRNAFALQRLFEKDARGGSRYIESLKVHFNVTSPDSRLQRPEYLGGSRIDINMNQVVQTSATGDGTPQGNVSGLSHTFDSSDCFFKSFTEHGYIIGLACVRPIHSYQNGIERSWLRRERFDFYYPSLAYIGEQPVYAEEIQASDKFITTDDGIVRNVFGYQEAWAEYRYKPNLITGKMRSGVNDSLDMWHYADDFSNRVVTLSPDFIVETGLSIDRSLALSSEVEPQFLADFYFNTSVTRAMPLYSVPGLIDHY